MYQKPDTKPPNVNGHSHPALDVMLQIVQRIEICCSKNVHDFLVLARGDEPLKDSRS